MATANPHSSTVQNELARGVLGLPSALVMSIATMAPAAAIFFNTIPQAGIVGSAIPLTYVIGFALALLVAHQVAALAAEMPGSGSFYTFVARGLGARSGFITGWLVLITYLLIAPFAFIALGDSLQADIQSWTGLNLPWEIWFLVSVVVVFTIVYLGIQESLRFYMTMIAIEVGICIALGLTVLAVLGGKGQLTSTPLTLSGLPKGANFFLGVVLAILSFLGFEAAATLGAETRNPKRYIPIAILGSAVVIGLFYVFMSYVAVVGFGVHDMAKYATNASPFGVIATHFWGRAGGTLVDIAQVVSFYGLGVAITNGTARILFTVGREGLFPRWLGEVSSSRNIPRNAVLGIGAIALLLGLGLGVWQTPIVAYGFLGTLDTVAFLVVFLLINGACFFYFWRHVGGSRFNWFRHALIPLVASLAVIAVLIGNLFPVPPAPYNTVPWIVVGWIIVGAVVVTVLGKRDPNALGRAGQVLAGEADLEVAPAPS